MDDSTSAVPMVTDITPAEPAAMLGPILMGEMAAIFFTGILLCTLHSFWQSPSWTHISKPLRWLTLFVCLLVTTQAALFTADIYSMGIQPINTLQNVSESSLAGSIPILLLTLVSTIVQVILVGRASKVINEAKWRWAYIAGMEILITVEFITALFTSVYEIRYALFPEEDFSLGALGWGISLQVWMLLSAIIDILISATYVYTLTRRMGGRTGNVGARLVMWTIIRLIVQSAAYTAFLAVATASVVFAFIDWQLMTQDISYAFDLPLAPLYALSLFTTLSIRDRVTEKVNNMSGFALPKEKETGSAPPGRRNNTQVSNGHSQQPPSIHLDVEKSLQRQDSYAKSSGDGDSPQ